MRTPFKIGPIRHSKIVAFVLITCFYMGFISVRAESRAPVIALVPLDNRPACLDYTVRIGRIAGADILTPPAAAIGAYSFPGDPDALKAWLDALDPAPDYLIISLDMLMYGGLVSMRTPETSEDLARSRLEAFREWARTHPKTRILAQGVIQRIARTGTGNKDEDNLTYLLGVYVKRVDEAEARNDDELRASAEDLRQRLPADPLEDYLAARKRNHALNRESIRLAADGVVDFLVLGMDDNAEYGPHRSERDALNALVADLSAGDRVIIKPGADELAHLLLARAINQWNAVSPRIAVHYYPAAAGEWLPDLEDRTLAQSLAQNLDVAGFRITSGRGVDAHLLVFGDSPDGDMDEQDAADRLAADLSALIKHKQAAGVADLRRMNSASPVLVQTMLQRTEPARLLAYSGWNTAGNALGTAVGHLAASLALRRSAERDSDVSAQAAQHAAFLLQRFFDDYLYMAVLRPDINKALSRQGESSIDISAARYPEFSREIKRQIRDRADELFEQYFKGRTFEIGGGETLQRFTISDLRLGVKIPWFRTFEIQMDVDVELVKK